MTNQSFSSDIRRFALAGAQARLAEISLELEAIRRAFPELRQNGSSGARTRRLAVAGGDEPAPAPTPSQHHVRRPAQSRRRTDEEVLGGAPGRSCNNGYRGRRSKRDSEGQGRSIRQGRQARSRQTRSPQDVSRGAEADVQAQKKRWAAKRKAA